MKSKSGSETLTYQVKRKATELGADIVGVAPVERFEIPPPVGEEKIHDYTSTSHGLTEMLPGARSVIVIGLRQLTGVMEANVSDVETTYPFGNFGYVHLNRTLNTITYELALWLEERTWTTLPLGAAPAARFDYRIYRSGETTTPLRGIFRVKRAAVLAGVGRIAKSELLATQRYGTKGRLGALITTAALAGDPMLEGSPCPPNCRICVDVCPTRAISPEGRVNHVKCYSDCGRRGVTVREVIDRMMKDFPSSEPGADYLASDHSAIDGFGSRRCRVACMALCPLGENPSRELLRRSKGWEKKHPKVHLATGEDRD